MQQNIKTKKCSKKKNRTRNEAIKKGVRLYGEMKHLMKYFRKTKNMNRHPRGEPGLGITFLDLKV